MAACQSTLLPTSRRGEVWTPRRVIPTNTGEWESVATIPTTKEPELPDLQESGAAMKML